MSYNVYTKKCLLYFLQQHFILILADSFDFWEFPF